MAETTTRTDCGTYDEVLVVVTDDASGVVLEERRTTEWKPGTPEHDEPINRDALADTLHTTLARISVRDDLDPDIRAALLLIHRFIHGDYSDDTI